MDGTARPAFGYARLRRASSKSGHARGVRTELGGCSENFNSRVTVDTFQTRTSITHTLFAR
jgi:hypothetical protein